MKVCIGGVNVDLYRVDELVDLFFKEKGLGFNLGRARFYTSLNGNALAHSGSNSIVKTILNDADGVVPDGMSIVFASKILKGPSLIERVVTTDFAIRVFERSNTSPLSVFFLEALKMKI